MDQPHRQISLQLFAFLLALLLIYALVGSAHARSTLRTAATLPPEDLFQNTATPQPQPSAETTEIVTLPLVEQNSSDQPITPVVDSLVIQATPVPGDQQFTPTPTVLPPQTGTTNLPIVIGGGVIVLIIFLAWLLVGWRPKSANDL